MLKEEEKPKKYTKKYINDKIQKCEWLKLTSTNEAQSAKYEEYRQFWIAKLSKKDQDLIEETPVILPKTEIEEKVIEDKKEFIRKEAELHQQQLDAEKKAEQARQDALKNAEIKQIKKQIEDLQKLIPKEEEGVNERDSKPEDSTHR